MKWMMVLAGIAGLIATDASFAQSRANTWETRLGIAFQNSADADFKGGTTADFDSDTGLRFGFGYFLNEHLEIGGNFGYGQTDYKAAIAGDEIGEVFDVKGEFEYTTFAGDVTWNFMSGPFSPFVTGALGWTWIDTNIATGPPQTGCWWDPWWGYVCSSFQDTKSLDGVTYQLGVGARYDFSSSFAVHGSYRMTWIDLDNAEGTPDFDGFELSVGWKF
jgi:opacity protein-like surface antigen